MNKKQLLKTKQEVMLAARAGQFEQAIQLAEAVVAASPTDAEVWNALGQLNSQLGRHQKALDAYEKISLLTRKVPADLYERIVDLCVLLKHDKKGLKHAQKLVKLAPNNDNAYFKLGMCYYGLDKNVDADSSFIKALELNPNNEKYLIQKSLNDLKLGYPEQAKLSFEKSLNLLESSAPKSSATPHAIYLWTLNYIDGLDDQTIYKSHLDIASSLFGRTDLQNKKFSEIKKDRIKLGFCSPDLYRHSVAYFFEPLLESLSKDKFEIYIYNDTHSNDEVTERLKAASNVWKDVQTFDDQTLYNEILSNEIDILIDLVGYVGKNRLGVFARRAAPIQATYLGYPNTTGLQQVDYRITDGWCDPVGMTESFHSEQLMRLPEGFLCFKPERNAPEVSSLPALENQGKICFGSFNIYQKISERNFENWSEILKAIPNSELLIKSKPLTDEKLQEEVWSKFEARGVDRSRITLIGWTLHRDDHLKILNTIDIHLDTYPYCGTTTTCEALWQGVPTLTLAGENHRSRVGLSLMTQLGLDDWVAQSNQEYLNKAITIANDLERLKLIRETLREKMRNTALGNGVMFAEQFQNLLHNMVDDYNDRRSET